MADTVSNDIIKGVQFDKRLFKYIAPRLKDRFVKSMLSRLNKIQLVLSGDVKAAGNRIRYIRLNDDKKIIKQRMGKRRISMIYDNGILTFIRISDHDHQMQELRRSTGKIAGMLYYDYDEFCKYLGNIQAAENHNISLSEYLDNQNNYIYDEEQQYIIDLAEINVNVSIIGNAGAGKSIIGIQWIFNELQKKYNDCIYLTLSKSLADELRYRLEQNIENSTEEILSKVTVSSTFRFMRDAARKIMPHIMERSYLDTENSFRQFKIFMKGLNNTVDENEILILWRDIHGFIKGALPLSFSFDNMSEISDCLTEDEFQRLCRKEGHHTDSKLDPFKIYKSYRDYLIKHNYLDDNDLARIIIKGDFKDKAMQKLKAVFIDECQDLTQVQMMALFKLLKHMRLKRLASDRCQMVQPTYFHEGNMRTLVNDYDRYLGNNVDENGLYPQTLHFNYRAAGNIVRFQNYIIKKFKEKNIVTLKDEELSEIMIPPLKDDGIMPIWITPNEENKAALLEIYQESSPGELQLILAHNDSSFPCNTSINMPTDILECKGMEYNNIFLYNIMNDIMPDRSMAWKYFYVGATRSVDLLFFYENFDSDDENIQEIKTIFDEAAADGLINKCEHLYDIMDSDETTWVNFIRKHLGHVTVEDKISTADSALKHGLYKIAMQIFKRISPDENLLLYCQAKIHEEAGNFADAVNCYEKIQDSWNYKGCNRKNGIEGLLENPYIHEQEFIVAFLIKNKLSGAGIINEMKTAFKKHFGQADNFYDNLYAALMNYDFLSGFIDKWNRSLIQKQNKQFNRLDNLIEHLN